MRKTQNNIIETVKNSENSYYLNGKNEILTCSKGLTTFRFCILHWAVFRKDYTVWRPILNVFEYDSLEGCRLENAMFWKDK